MANEITLNSFHPQAYLMYLNFASPSSLKLSSLTPANMGTGVHMLKGLYRPDSVMSKVYNTKDATGKNLTKAHFFNLETHKISALVPEIRFYKAQEGKLEPFFFPISTVADSAAITSGNSRTKGSGVQSFSVQFEGTNPFEAPRFLTADLSLYVDSLANLFDTEPGYAPLADLFTISIGKPAQKSSTGGSTLGPSDFIRPIEVAATLGYAVNDTSVFTQEEIREIQDSNLPLRMNVYHHNIDVAQNGSATITVRYTARINNTARDRIFSAIDSPIDILRRANIKQLLAPQKKKIDKVSKEKDDEGVNSDRKSQQEKMKEIRKILELLEAEKKIFSIETTDAKLLSFTQLGVSDEIKEFLLPTAAAPARDVVTIGDDFEFAVTTPAPPPKTPEERLLEKSAETLTKRLSSIDNSKRRVHYITFGDLIQAFFENFHLQLRAAKKLLSDAANFLNSKATDLTDPELAAARKLAKKSNDERTKIEKVLEEASEKLKTFRIYLPDVEYKHYSEGSEGTSEAIKRINISDIPISLEVYQGFMFEKIMNSYRNTWTPPQFLNDCITELLPAVFGQKWSKSGIASKIIHTAPSFTSTTFSAPQLRGSLSRSAAIDAEKAPSPQKNFRAASLNDECDYFVVYQSLDRELTTDRQGNADADARDGIYHFEIGKNRGLTKNISFSRFEVPGAQEQLMTNQVGLYDELKLPYSAKISMFGNNLFTPGSQIYINPSNIGFGLPDDPNSPAFKIGLGGYYTVLTVETSFNDGVLSTELNCSFGSPASNTIGLTGAKPKERSIDEVPRAATSSDAEPEELPDLDTSKTQVAQSHYLQQLLTLRDPLTGERVMSQSTARQVSNDYILHQDSNMVAIPGILDKSINAQSGAVRYNLTTGQSVEIDDSVPSDESVKLVKNPSSSLAAASAKSMRSQTQGRGR